MSDELIKILIADSEGATCDAICSFLTGDPTYQLVGKAVNADECLSLALIKRPDIVVVTNSLKPSSGLEVCEQLGLQNPNIATVLVLNQSMDENMFRRMMTAGVTDFVLAPLQKARTVEVLHATYEKKNSQGRTTTESPVAAEPQQKIIAVCGSRGGCGRTMLAVNLSCALAKANEQQVRRVALADINVRGGDASTFFDLHPRRTLADVPTSSGSVDREVIESLLESHESGVTILSATASEPYDRMELSRGIIVSTLAVLRSRFPITVVDAPAPGIEGTDAALDFCDVILLVVGMDLPRLRAARLFLHHLLEFNFPREKIQIVLNDIQAESKSIGTPQAESILECPIATRIPNDGKLVPNSINLGQPFVLTNPEKPISRSIQELAGKLVGAAPGPTVTQPGIGGLFKRFGFSSLTQRREQNSALSSVAKNHGAV